MCVVLLWIQKYLAMISCSFCCFFVSLLKNFMSLCFFQWLGWCMQLIFSCKINSVIPLILFCSLRMIIIPLKLKSLQQGVNMQDISFSKLIIKNNKFASPVIFILIYLYISSFFTISKLIYGFYYNNYYS